MRTELYLHISSVHPTNFILLTPNEQLEVLMSEEFIYLTIDFVEQAWRKRQSSISLVIFIAMYFIIIIIIIIIFFFKLFLCYYFLCNAVQFKVTNKPLRAGYQLIILYFLFVLYVCTMSL